MIFGKYEKETVSFLKKEIKPDMTVLDIGAHIGYFTRILAKLVGPNGLVLAFEPEEENFKMLRDNTAHLRNVKAYKLAVSNKAGAIDFYLSGGRSGNHSSVAGVVPDQKKITVSSVVLDYFLEKEKISKVDFIKMDIEGGEPKALDGMKVILLNNENIVLMSEFAPAWLKAAGTEPLDYLQNFKSLNFKVFAILNNGLLPFAPENEAEMRAAMHSYFINIYCRRN